MNSWRVIPAWKMTFVRPSRVWSWFTACWGWARRRARGRAAASGLDHRIESGRRIAGYRVVRELGRGGMGTVYEAVHVGLDRPVALKVLGVHAAPDSSARRRFLERGPHSGRAAPHPHRAGLRRRPGRRAVLLRHAADRGERARPRAQASPPHAPGAPRAAERRFPARGLPSFLASGRAGARSIRSRLGRSVGPVLGELAAGGGTSSTVRPEQRRRHGADRPRRFPQGGRPESIGSRPPSEPDGSTASWGTASARRAANRLPAVAGGFRRVAGALASLAAADPDRSGRRRAAAVRSAARAGLLPLGRQGRPASRPTHSRMRTSRA